MAKSVWSKIEKPVFYLVEFEGEKRYVTIPEDDEARA